MGVVESIDRPSAILKETSCSEGSKQFRKTHRQRQVSEHQIVHFCGKNDRPRRFSRKGYRSNCIILALWKTELLPSTTEFHLVMGIRHETVWEATSMQSRTFLMHCLWLEHQAQSPVTNRRRKVWTKNPQSKLKCTSANLFCSCLQ